MTPLDESVLREALRERSELAADPPAPVDHLLEGGRHTVRRRRTRLGVVAGVAAIATALGVGIALRPGDPRSDGPVSPSPTSTPTQVPRTLAQLPRGDLPVAPFAVRESLFADGISTDFEDGQVRSILRGHDDDVDTWTVVISKDSGDGYGPLELLDPETGGRSAQITKSMGGSAAVSADGRRVAWQDVGPDGTARVHVWDVASRSAGAVLSFPFTPTCCDNPFLLEGIDADGRVFGHGGTTSWVVPAADGSEPVPIRGLGAGAVIDEVGASRLIVNDHATATLRVGRLDGDRFAEDLHLAASQATLSWDEQRLAYSDTGAVRVRDLESGRDVDIRLPSDVVGNGGLTWETSTDLLVQVQARTGEADGNAWLRCSAESGACELAATFQTELVVLPRR